MSVKFRSTFRYRQRSQAAVQAAVRAVSLEINGRFQDAIGAKVWNWPGTTIRSNGQEVGSPRTIVDTGNLRNSNTYSVVGNRSVHRWSAEYASAIHEGASLKNGGIITPRPWTDAVLGNVRVTGIPVYDYRKAMFDKWLNHIQNRR